MALLLVLAALVMQVVSQPGNTIHVNTTHPDGIPFIPAREANFGPSYADTLQRLPYPLLTTDPVDGCDSISTNLTGAIALIRRGTCYFLDKAYRAQQAGAAGVLIYNHLHQPRLITMSPASRHGVTPEALQVSALFITRHSVKLWAGGTDIKVVLQPVVGAISGCTDRVLATGAQWHDADGMDYNCAWYSNDQRCADYGSSFAFQGMTAKQACCVCGGGERPTNAPSPPVPTGTPTTIHPTSPLPSLAPTTAAPSETSPTSNPSAPPTIAPTAQCVDKELSHGTWHDSDGTHYNCAWYSMAHGCDTWGDLYSNEGLTASNACCTCGGGIRPTQAPTTPPPSYAPTSSAPTPPSAAPTTGVPTQAPTQLPTSMPPSDNVVMTEILLRGLSSFDVSVRESFVHSWGNLLGADLLAPVEVVKYVIKDDRRSPSVEVTFQAAAQSPALANSIANSITSAFVSHSFVSVFNSELQSSPTLQHLSVDEIAVLRQPTATSSSRGNGVDSHNKGAQGSDLTLWIMLGVGVAIMATGGIAAYLKFRKHPRDSSPQVDITLSSWEATAPPTYIEARRASLTEGFRDDSLHGAPPPSYAQARQDSLTEIETVPLTPRAQVVHVEDEHTHGSAIVTAHVIEPSDLDSPPPVYLANLNDAVVEANQLHILGAMGEEMTDCAIISKVAE